MTQPSVKHRNKAEWPGDAATKVLGDAMMVSHDAAIQTWYLIRDQLFGNANKMEDLANIWGRDKTMTTSKAEIDTALQNLSGYWQGGGFSAYRTYSTDTSAKFSENERIMNDISGIMSDCIDLVYSTYGDAIELISTCAHELAEFGLENLVPVGGQLVKVWNVLNDFVKAWADLYAKSVRKMGQLIKGKVTLYKLANDFHGLTVPGSGSEAGDTPQRMPGAAGNPDMWDVTPT